MLGFTLHKFHHDTMSVEIDGLWHRESAVIECLHVGELFRCRNPGQVDPTHLLPLLVVVPLFTDLPETRPPQSVELQAERRRTLRVPDNVDVGLFPGTNLVAERGDGTPCSQSLKEMTTVGD